MKLTNKDKKYLRKCGYLDEDMQQIERATRKTVYSINHTSLSSVFNKNDKISCQEAIELLGRETFLDGIARSAFHF